MRFQKKPYQAFFSTFFNQYSKKEKRKISFSL
jgi:hypothetical protein